MNTLKLTQIEPYNYANWFNLSYYALFVNKPEVAISAAKKSLELVPPKTAVISNLVLGYLLSNQWDKAEKIYNEWKGKTFLRVYSKCEEIFIKDIEELKDAGIEHPDFEKAIKLLKE